MAKPTAVAKIRPGGRFPRRAAVLGAGTMGAQIAALLANAGVPTLLYDLPSPGDPNAIARRALRRLRLRQPPPLALPERLCYIEPLNYAEHLHRLRDCDLVIEAINERLDDKQGFYARIAPHLGADTLFTTTTSGLSINRLAQALPENRRVNFCGTQFFNPPRYRPLVELVPNAATEPDRLDGLEHFLYHGLGKSVLRANDTPHFIANRVGLTALLIATRHAERYKLPPRRVDALTRAAFDLDHPAVYGAFDAIGISHIEQTLDDARRSLPDDPWLAALRLPHWLRALGAAGAAVYRCRDGRREVFDPFDGYHHRDDRDDAAHLDAGVRAALDESEPGARFLVLRANRHPQAQFLTAVLRDVLHYGAVSLPQIADDATQIDAAMRWGFGWARGPFEFWRALGWSTTRAWLDDERAAGRTLVAAALPDWTRRGEPAGVAPYAGRVDASSELIYRYGALRLDRGADDVAVLRADDHDAAVDDPAAALAGALRAAAQHSAALVLCLSDCGDPDRPAARRPTLAERLTSSGERGALCRALRASPLPVVGAVCRYSLDASFELQLYCDQVVTTLETRFGFATDVDSDIAAMTGDGPRLPDDAVYQEFARRAVIAAGDYPLLPFLQPYFDWLLQRRPALNALEARKIGLLSAADSIIMQPRQLLTAARATAAALAAGGYRSPPLVAARTDADASAALAAFAAQLDERRHAGDGSAQRGLRIAAALCGAVRSQRALTAAA